MRKAKSIEKNRQKALIKYRRNIRNVFMIGVPLFLYGAYYLLFRPVGLGVNLWTHQPVIVNGTVPLILGLGFIIGSIWGMKNKLRFIDNEIKRLNVNRKRFRHLQ